MIEYLKTGIGALFLVVSLGLIIGKIKIKGISLELSGILFAGLILGHFQFEIPKIFLNFGLVIFVFTVGMQTGPSFFDAFRKNGQKFLLLSFIVLSITAILAFFVGKITGIGKELNVGAFAGALTSSPGLAAATEASKSPLVSIAYGLAYPIGIIGVILGVNFLPKILKIDFKKEESEYLASLRKDFPEISGKTFEITNPNLNEKYLHEINLREITNTTASRILHNNKAYTPTSDSQIFTSDLIRLVGTEDALKKAELVFGTPVEKQIPLTDKYDIRWIIVTNKKIINKTYKNINISAYNCSVVKIRRSGIDITPTPETYFKFGDKLLIAGSKNGVDKAAEIIGNNKKLLSDTDFIPIFLGVLLGVFIGKIKIPIGNLFDFSLGNTGGVLIAGLLLSRIGKTGPILWTLSSSANQLLRQLGLALFLAVIGTQAGVNLVQTIQDLGVYLLLISILITFSPICLGILIGRYIFKFNFLTLLGLITGLMTSTPGLGVVQSKSDTNAAPVAYATVYPFALVLVIIFSQLLVLL
ncbi:MAG: transporter [Bacteroidales bacterium]|nr:transporter [Bacteroidales bacterium]